LKPVLDVNCDAKQESPPARGRGLKLRMLAMRQAMKKSPPARGRGLKHDGEDPVRCTQGRPPRGGVD